MSIICSTCPTGSAHNSYFCEWCLSIMDYRLQGETDFLDSYEMSERAL